MGRNLLMGGMQRGGTGEMKMKMKKKGCLVLSPLSLQSLVNIQQVSNVHLQRAGTILEVRYIYQ